MKIISYSSENMKDNEKQYVDIGLTNDVINVDGSIEKDEDIYHDMI